jgi:hypothetical protein
MNERQRDFVSRVLERKNDENRPILETVLKAYIMNEGIFEKSKNTAVSRAMQRRPSSVQDYNAVNRAIMCEPDCWEHDLKHFYENCEMVRYYISTYGIRKFNEVVNSDDFQSALAFGRELDRVRRNPLLIAESRRKNMHECLDMLRRGTDPALLEGIMMDFDQSEHMTVGLPPMMESREDNLPSFMNSMSGIANFIRRHGVYPWEKFLHENRLLLARAHRFDQVEYPKAEDAINPAIAADVRKAYSVGSAES